MPHPRTHDALPAAQPRRYATSARTLAAFATFALASVGQAQVRVLPDDPAQRPVVRPGANSGAVAGPQAEPAILAPQDLDAQAILDARRLLASDKPSDAKSILDDLLERLEGTESPRIPEALYLRGNALLMMDDEYDALYDYERLVREYPGSEFFAKALERELDIAKLYLNGRRRPGIFGLRIDSGVPLAEELITRIGERLPGSRLAERAILELADHYARERDLRMASETYDVFVRLFPRSPQRSKAMQKRIYATVAQFKGPRYDVRVLKDAMVQVEDFAGEFPAEAQRAGLNDGLVARLDESAAAGMLSQAQWYLDRDDPVSARFSLVRLVKRHPKTGAAQEALTLIQQIDADEPGIKPRAPANPPEASSVAPEQGGSR